MSAKLLFTDKRNREAQISFAATFDISWWKKNRILQKCNTSLQRQKQLGRSVVSLSVEFVWLKLAIMALSL